MNLRAWCLIIIIVGCLFPLEAKVVVMQTAAHTGVLWWRLIDVNVFNVHILLTPLYGNCIYMNLSIYLCIYLSIVYIHIYVCTRTTPLSYAVNYPIMYKDDVPNSAFTLYAHSTNIYA